MIAKSFKKFEDNLERVNEEELNTQNKVQAINESRRYITSNGSNTK